MTKEQRLELLKLIEEQIYVSSLESTFLDDSKSVAIHSIVEEETERIYKKEGEEQEPCEEYVSREAVEDAIAEYEIDGERIGYRAACDIVSELPSFVPKQEPVLDKIRAEIEASKWTDKDIRIERNALASGLDKALEIIDKYKAESEDKR